MSLMTSSDIFVVTYKMSNFLPKLVDMLLFSREFPFFEFPIFGYCRWLLTSVSTLSATWLNIDELTTLMPSTKGLAPRSSCIALKTNCPKNRFGAKSEWKHPLYWLTPSPHRARDVSRRKKWPSPPLFAHCCSCCTVCEHPIDSWNI